MRILILHNFYQHLGGEDTVVQQEAHALRQRGHEVIILNDKNSKGIRGLVQYLLYSFNFFISRKLVKQINTINPDIVHVHNLHYAIGPFILRKIKRQGYPIVMTLHNFRLICPSATLFYRGKLFMNSITEDFPTTAVRLKVLDNSYIKTFITAFTYWIHKKIGTWDLIDAYFTFSDFSKDIFKKSHRISNSDKFIIKPNFINCPTNSLKIFEDHFIYIGRLSEEKGIIQLIEAFSKTQHILKIFGSGPQEDLVRGYSSKYPNIKYLGFQNKTKLSQEICLANALIVPSICYEGMPMTIIEAFALGTPVLTSKIGILEQMIVPLHTGLHFDPHSAQSIIQALDEWRTLDIYTKNRISKNCIDEYLHKYTEEKNIKLIEDTYRKILIHEHNNN